MGHGAPKKEGEPGDSAGDFFFGMVKLSDPKSKVVVNVTSLRRIGIKGYWGRITWDSI